MAVIEELIRLEKDGTISFGNYLMDTKKKVLDFDVDGDLYKVKTFREITKFEKNGRLVLESVPGSTIHNFKMTERKTEFKVEAEEDIQITMELEPETEYKIYIDEVNVGKILSNLAGKVNFSVEFKNKVLDIVLEKVN